MSGLKARNLIHCAHTWDVATALSVMSGLKDIANRVEMVMLKDVATALSVMSGLKVRRAAAMT